MKFQREIKSIIKFGFWVAGDRSKARLVISVVEASLYSQGQSTIFYRDIALSISLVKHKITKIN
jgi:hypothetical protein